MPQQQRDEFCELCGSDRFEEIYRKIDCGYTWQLMRCQECGLVSLFPRLPADEVLKLYSSESKYHEDLIESTDVKHIKRAEYQVKILRNFCSNGKVLDIGCSTGIFLHYAKQCGYEVVGVDVNPNTSAYARDELGLNVFTGMLYQAAFNNKEFDIVTLWDVLEHDLNPKALLSQIYKILKPKGFLFISCPNIEGLFPKLTYKLIYKTTKRWEFPTIPHHIYEFTPGSMTLMLQETGLSVINFLSTSIPQWIYLKGFRPRKEHCWKLKVFKLSAFILYKFLFTTIYPVASLLRKGNAFITIARKV